MTRYVYCSVQDAVVPVEQRKDEPSHSTYIWTDEMEPTRNPINPKQVFTSKKMLRAEYRAHGAVEIGDAYDRGYVPGREQENRVDKLAKDIKHKIAERLNYGRR